MIENTNKAIAVNSIILYVRMVMTTLCSILTTRFALQALGVVDFGLFSLLGGIITFVSIFNNIMLTTSNRFIAVAIGKGNMNDINQQFNVNLVIHVLIAVGTAIVAFPIGDWYINNYVNYEGDISNALLVFNISIAASVFSFIGVPYNGLLMAKEKFIVFSSVDVFSHIIKLIAAYLLISHFTDKLLLYTIVMAMCTALPVLVYWLYCKTKYPSIIKIHMVRDKSKYKVILGFSMWVSVGAFAMVTRSQGAALLVNAFFNTVMNTALGISQSVCSYLNLFSQTVTQPMAPQITKSYSAGDTKRTDELLLMSTKYAYLFMLLASSPFLVSTDWILTLWLGQVPPYAKVFIILLVIDGLVLALNAGISNVIFASGKIKKYQIITSALNLMAVVAGYLVLRIGMPIYWLLVVYIVFSFIRVVVIQIILKMELGYNNNLLFRGSYLPCLKVTIMFIPITIISGLFNPIVWIVVSIAYLLLLTCFLGFNKKERIILKEKINVILNKI